MTKTPQVLAVTALCALLGPLSACSSSDSDGSSASSGSSSPTSPAPTWKETSKDCTADVTLTGAVKATWSGEATTASGDGRNSSYSSASKDGATTVAVLPAEDKIPAAVSVAAGGNTFTSQSSAKGIKADPKGKGATIDSDATTLVKGKVQTVHVVAEFDC